MTRGPPCQTLARSPPRHGGCARPCAYRGRPSGAPCPRTRRCASTAGSRVDSRVPKPRRTCPLSPVALIPGGGILRDKDQKPCLTRAYTVEVTSFARGCLDLCSRESRARRLCIMQPPWRCTTHSSVHNAARSIMTGSHGRSNRPHASKERAGRPRSSGHQGAWAVSSTTRGASRKTPSLETSGIPRRIAVAAAHRSASWTRWLKA